MVAHLILAPSLHSVKRRATQFHVAGKKEDRVDRVRAVLRAKEDAPKRVAAIRFRLTMDELDIIAAAASEDADDLQGELERRGLSGSLLANLYSPAEWAREVVLDHAKKKLRERGIKTPAEARRERQEVEQMLERERRATMIEAELGPERAARHRKGMEKWDTEAKDKDK
jgi:hypothetical protein